MDSIVCDVVMESQMKSIGGRRSSTSPRLIGIGIYRMPGLQLKPLTPGDVGDVNPRQRQ